MAAPCAPKVRGLSQEQVAERAGIHPKHLQWIERGRSNATFSGASCSTNQWCTSTDHVAVDTTIAFSGTISPHGALTATVTNGTGGTITFAIGAESLTDIAAVSPFPAGLTLTRPAP